MNGAQRLEIWRWRGRRFAGLRLLGSNGGRRVWTAAVLGVLLLALPGCDQRVPNGPSTVTVPEDLPAAVAPPKRVLLVQSRWKSHVWGSEITRGVQQAMEMANVDLEIFYLDAEGRIDEVSREAAAQTALRAVEAWRPDVVIAVDDLAQRRFARHLVGRDRPQVVFCGVNALAEEYGYPASNVTGILERPAFTESLALFARLVPSARRVVVLTDGSPTSRGALRSMREQSASLDVVSWETAETFEAWQKAVEHAQTRADALAVYAYHAVHRADSIQGMAPRDVMGWTIRNSRIPVIGFFISTIDEGALCGVVESGVEHGKVAGRIAIGLLAGKRPADFPIRVEQHSLVMLNAKTAHDLKLTIPPELRQAADIIVGE